MRPWWPRPLVLIGHVVGHPKIGHAGREENSNPIGLSSLAHRRGPLGYDQPKRQALAVHLQLAAAHGAGGMALGAPASDPGL